MSAAKALRAARGALAKLESGAGVKADGLVGTPPVPTAPVDDRGPQIANTEFVQAAIDAAFARFLQG